MSNETLVNELAPVFDALDGIDLSDPAAAAAKLNETLPLGSLDNIRKLFEQGVDEGWLCDREAGGARFSRVAKPGESTKGYSIDAVSMKGPGVWHRHTEGEIDLCFAVSGEPRFDGNDEGWVVFGKGSEHVPTVEGGTMNILYFLPQGAVEWKR